MRSNYRYWLKECIIVFDRFILYDMDSLKLFKAVTQIGNKIWFIILYYILGFKSMLEDFFNRKYNKCELKDRTGYVAVVTGGARGIGSELVKLLMQCNMHVIIGCREIDAGKKLISDIRKSGVEKGDASVLYLDLKSLTCVRNFAEQVLKSYDQVNLLVNNGGIMFVPYAETEDGFESHFAVNYLSHFLLTHLLLPAMKNCSSATPPRIVNVSSCAHELSPSIDFNDLNMKNGYIEHAAYSQSKACQLMFTKVLARRLKDSSSSVQVVAVHPGVVNTELFEGTFVKLVAPWYLNLFCKSPIEGGISVLYACISDELNDKSGLYTANCRIVKSTQYVDHVGIQDKLYDVSTEAVKQFLN